MRSSVVPSYAFARRNGEINVNCCGEAIFRKFLDFIKKNVLISKPRMAIHYGTGTICISFGLKVRYVKFAEVLTGISGVT